MNIAIFDPSGSHGHYAYSQSLIFKSDHVKWYIHESLTKRLCDLKVLNASDPNVKTYNKISSKFIYYLRSVFDLNKQEFDMVWINTLQMDWFLNLILFILLKKNTPVVLTIHNINSFFAIKNKISLRSILINLTKKLAIKKSTYFNVFSQNLKEQLLKKRPGSKIFLLPFQVYCPSKNSASINKSCRLKIVIPGTVDLNRRDYFGVLEIIKYFSNDTNFQFVLLGKPVTEKSKVFLNGLAKYSKIAIFYDDFVSESEYETQMNNADLIWSPLHKEYEIEGEIEEYGVSKETGATFAMIRYGLPGLFPSNITIMSEIISGSLIYNSTRHLVNILDELCSSPTKLKELKKKALENARQFEPLKIRNQLLEIEPDLVN